MMIFTSMASKYKFVQLEADSSVALLDERKPLLKTTKSTG